MRMPGTRGGDRPELAADLGRGVRLHVPDVELAGPAVEQEQDARADRGVRGPVARPEQPGQRQAEGAQSADLQQAAARVSADGRSGIRSTRQALRVGTRNMSAESSLPT